MSGHKPWYKIPFKNRPFHYHVSRYEYPLEDDDEAPVGMAHGYSLYACNVLRTEGDPPNFRCCMDARLPSWLFPIGML